MHPTRQSCHTSIHALRERGGGAQKTGSSVGEAYCGPSVSRMMIKPCMTSLPRCSPPSLVRLLVDPRVVRFRRTWSTELVCVCAKNKTQVWVSLARLGRGKVERRVKTNRLLFTALADLASLVRPYEFQHTAPPPRRRKSKHPCHVLETNSSRQPASNLSVHLSERLKLWAAPTP